MKNIEPIFDKRNPMQKSLLISPIQKRCATPQNSETKNADEKNNEKNNEKNVLSLLSPENSVADFNFNATVPSNKPYLHPQIVSVPHVDSFLGGMTLGSKFVNI